MCKEKEIFVHSGNDNGIKDTIVLVNHSNGQQKIGNFNNMKYKKDEAQQD